jgi:7-cyano-7-deazaguanine synthase
MTNALVLFSGGQDSTTCLAWAMAENRFDDVAALSFDYGQRHAVELRCADDIADAWGVPHWSLGLPILHELHGGALTDGSRKIEAQATSGYQADKKLPSTFIPGRNLLFFTAAAAFGVPRGYEALVTGICQADAAGYPDCRAEFAEAALAAIRLALAEPRFMLAAPLLHRSKAETWKLAEELGVLEDVIRRTHTCYQGDRSHLHPWGYGCGECPACTERANGWAEAFGDPAVV